MNRTHKFTSACIFIVFTIFAGFARTKFYRHLNNSTCVILSSFSLHHFVFVSSFLFSVRIFVGKTKQPWQQNEKEHQLLFSLLSSLVFMGIDVAVVYFTILSKSRLGSFLADKTEERKQSKTCEKISPSDLVGPWP